MLKFIAAAAIALSLGGCATLNAIEGATVSPTQIIVAANSFDAIEATATNYLRLPPCPQATVCRTQAAVSAIVPAIRAGRKARNQLEAYVSTNAPAPVAAFNVLTTAISTLQSLMAQYNVAH